MAEQTTTEPGSTGEVQKPDQSKSHRTQLQSFWNAYRKNYLSLVGGTILVFVFLMALFAPFIAPHPPEAQYDSPGTERHPLPPGTQLEKGGEVVGTAYLGTDHFGRDMLSRVMYGTRTMLMVAVGVVGWSLVAGVIAGGIAGYYGNTKIDDIIMRFMDVLFSFPSLVLAVAVVGALGIGDTDLGYFVLPNLAKIIIVVGVIYVPSFARVMRSATLKEMEEDYVNAAQALGASNRRIFLREVLINTVPSVVVQATIYLGTAILVSAGLSFLGLGIQPPRASLGLMLSDSRSYLYSGEWWYSVFPGLMIVIVILAFNLMGDGLRDALDPRHTREERK